MSVPNAARGEFVFKLGDHELVMVPSYKNISKIEAALGRSLLTPTIPTLREYVLIIDGLAKKPKPDADDMGDLLMAQGLKTATPVVSSLIESLANGNNAGGDEGNGEQPASAG